MARDGAPATPDRSGSADAYEVAVTATGLWLLAIDRDHAADVDTGRPAAPAVRRQYRSGLRPDHGQTENPPVRLSLPRLRRVGATAGLLVLSGCGHLYSTHPAHPPSMAEADALAHGFVQSTVVHSAVPITPQPGPSFGDGACEDALGRPKTMVDRTVNVDFGLSPDPSTLARLFDSVRSYWRSQGWTIGAVDPGSQSPVLGASRDGFSATLRVNKATRNAELTVVTPCVAPLHP